jgi:diacylglycerol kinase (ATP)
LAVESEGQVMEVSDISNTRSRRRPFSLAARFRSFCYAAKGIWFMLRTQHNAWIHLAITASVCAIGWQIGVSIGDWRWLAAAMALVWFAETTNTAFEYVCDVVSPGFHASVERAKDIAAGAVLICACGAAVIGLLTLWPYFAGQGSF